MSKSRARQEEQKRERRRAILAIAGRLFEETSFQAITMAQVADRAGLAKGTLYLYFQTKEALFLALLEDELVAWFAGLDAALEGLAARLTPREAAGVLGRSLDGHPGLIRLLGILHAVLEQNVAPERVSEFKRALLAQTVRTGGLLERRMPYLTVGQGARLLLRANALVVGLQQMAFPAPAAAEAMRQDPALALFEVDFARELEETLAALITGMERLGGNDEQARVAGKDRTDYGRFERPWG